MANQTYPSKVLSVHIETVLSFSEFFLAKLFKDNIMKINTTKFLKYLMKLYFRKTLFACCIERFSFNLIENSAAVGMIFLSKMFTLYVKSNDPKNHLNHKELIISMFVAEVLDFLQVLGLF